MTVLAIECDLCHQSTHHPITGADGRLFCCTACEQVAELITQQPLDTASSTSDAVDLDNLTLQLDGLWCTSCAWLIEEKLKRAPGVQDARVSFIQRQAKVDFDAQRTGPQELKRHVRALGYRASHQEGEHEEEGFFTRLLVGGMLAMHIMALSAIIYVREALGLASPETQWLNQFFYLMQSVLSVPLVFLLGLPVLRAGIAGLLRRLPGTHTLVALGSISALALSVRNLLLQSGHVYFDTAAMLLLLITVGRWLEMRAHRVSKEALADMIQYLPSEVRVSDKGETRVEALAKIAPGVRLRVLPGEHLPVDGVIASGRCELDESLLTGEPNPVLRQVGDKVLAGSQNLDGEIEIIASAVGEQTRAGQIASILQEAMWQRSPAERLADRLAAWLIPAAIAVAALTFLFWNSQVGVEPALLNALSVLLIACPCALSLATPLTLWQALGRARDQGLLLRSTAVLEKMRGIRHIFFDKTGTLSRLPMRVQRIRSLGMDEATLLQMVASVEQHSQHPLADALVTEATSRGLTLQEVSDFEQRAGQGLRARLGREPIAVGNRALLDAENVSAALELEEQAEGWRRAGLMVIYVICNGRVCGLLGVGEAARPEARQALAMLQGADLTVEVLTGDEAAAGERWQKALGVTVHAALQPEEKLAYISGPSGKVAMVGDGINDGPALAAADLGIALNQGANLARATADVVLLHDDLLAIPWLFDLAEESHRRVVENLRWALVYNLAGVGLAVAGLLQPVWAALAMVASSFLVTRNALRLKAFPLSGQSTQLPSSPAVLNPDLEKTLP